MFLQCYNFICCFWKKTSTQTRSKNYGKRILKIRKSTCYWHKTNTHTHTKPKKTQQHRTPVTLIQGSYCKEEFSLGSKTGRTGPMQRSFCSFSQISWWTQKKPQILLCSPLASIWLRLHLFTKNLWKPRNIYCNIWYCKIIIMEK